MAAPLRSANPGQQESRQFAHFGVLDAGHQSKASTITSLVLNIVIACVVIIISLATAKQTIERNKLLTNLVVPIEQKKPEPVKPKVVPPKPKLPDLPKIEPKITVPQIVKLPEPPKPVIAKMEEVKPILAPPAPKKIVAMAAPVAVSLAHPQAASVVNNDPHPTAVQIGHPDMPFKDPKGPAVSAVNLNSGFPGMNAANTGHGPPATKVVLGNGSPGGTTIKGNGVIAAVGIPKGVPGGTGTGPARAVGQVSLGQTPPPPAPKAATVATAVGGSPAKVTAKPKPEYTEEARQLHIEGTVTLKIRVMPDASVQVLSVISGLGHGLDESAKRAIMSTKFVPATDSSGHPIAWDGIVNVAFQLAG